MRADVKAQWVEALRSGNYKQGTGALHNLDDNTFCCLGVLCDLAVKAGVEVKVNEGWSSGRVAKYAGNSGNLPLVVQEWAGLARRDPETSITDEGGYQASLAEINDGFDYTFEQIADLIEGEF